VSLLAWCLVWCPKKRFTAKICFKHLQQLKLLSIVRWKRLLAKVRLW